MSDVTRILSAIEKGDEHTVDKLGATGISVSVQDLEPNEHRGTNSVAKTFFHPAPCEGYVLTRAKQASQIELQSIDAGKLNETYRTGVG